MLVDNAELVRALSNVLAFMPARGTWPWLRAQGKPGGLLLTGSDSYTIGQDLCPPYAPNPKARKLRRVPPSWTGAYHGLPMPEEPDPDAPPPPYDPPLTFVLTRDGAQAVEAAARKLRTEVGRWMVSDDLTLVYEPAEREERVVLQDVRVDDPEIVDRMVEAFTLCDSLLERLEGRTPNLPELLAFSPGLLSRFAKVKPSAGDPVADFYIFDASEPVLVKCGPTFRGAIQPIARAKAPEGSLWA